MKKIVIILLAIITTLLLSPLYIYAQICQGQSSTGTLNPCTANVQVLLNVTGSSHLGTITTGNFDAVRYAAHGTTDTTVLATKDFVADNYVDLVEYESSAASAIDAGQVANWDDAHSWGDHAAAGYDPSTTNEIQDLSLSGNTLSLSGDPTTVNLSGYLDNTDAQTLALASNNLSISGGNSVSLAAYLDNTDNQDLSLSGTTLNLTNDASSVSLSAFLRGDIGTTTFSGVTLQTQYTVTHGLSYTPSSVLVQPRSPNAAALSYVDNVTSTTFRITFLTVPVIGTNNISFTWVSIR